MHGIQKTGFDGMSTAGYWGKASSDKDLLRDWSRGIDIRVGGPVLEGKVSLEEKLRMDRVVRLRESRRMDEPDQANRG